MAELRQLLAGSGVELEEWGGEVEETGATYAENAALKAVAALQATGLPALGDDSGLEIEALGGEPGLNSRRLGPTQAARNTELWRRLATVPRPWKARFVAVLALAPGPSRAVELFEGRVEGELLPEARGSGGFGYDPIFLLPELGRTFAELEPAEKHRWSHRGRAAQALLASGALSSIE